MDSHAVSSPTIFGPLSSMFSQEAHDAILAEELAEAAATSAAETSATAEAMGAEGLPVQHLLLSE